MSKDSSSGSSAGIGAGTLLTVVFITLKLCGVIAWSWWWVLSPIWISISAVLGILIVAGIFIFLKYLINK